MEIGRIGARSDTEPLTNLVRTSSDRTRTEIGRNLLEQESDTDLQRIGRKFSQGFVFLDDPLFICSCH
jgi:hypothetical protein